MFIDEAEIFVEAGNGGNGCRSFCHARDRKKRRPDGGDGGRGGHVVIGADNNLYTLKEFRYKKNIKAKGGVSGGSNNKKGKEAQDYLIKVPLGTLVYSADNGLLLRDLTDASCRVVIVNGGRGGRGNAKLPEAELGSVGEKLRLRLELKSMAEVGLVGWPNAGKSSLISSISKAKPKIAAYPFTTKSPVIGIVEYEDDIFKVADIPGLIEGAHKGTGLGDRFLRHIERTKLLLFLIDMAGVDGRLPWDDYLCLRKELGLYNQKLLENPHLVVANKMDLEASKKNLNEFKKRIKEDIVRISCKENKGLENLVYKIHERL